MLLVLGLAILAGETRERHQSYNVLATRVAAGLLCLATVSLLAPVRLPKPSSSSSADAVFAVNPEACVRRSHDRTQDGQPE